MLINNNETKFHCYFNNIILGFTQVFLIFFIKIHFFIEILRSVLISLVETMPRMGIFVSVKLHLSRRRTNTRHEDLGNIMNSFHKQALCLNSDKDCVNVSK